MKKLFLLLACIPIFCFGQWNQTGIAIDGISINDQLGDFNAIAIDSAGNTVAVGSSRNSDLGQFFGYTKILDWDGNQWIQRGATFIGSVGFEGTGAAVDLSANGNTVAISHPWGMNSLGYSCGVVAVYDWNGANWVQRGDTINGEGNPISNYSEDVFGSALSLSPDGNYLAIGAPSNTQEVGVLQEQGQVRVYQWDGQEWMQMGQDIDGEISLEEFGRSIDISADGTILAAGGRNYNIWINGVLQLQNAGIVRTYIWNGSQWNPRDTAITGLAQGDKFGSSVSLSDDGNRMAVSSLKVNGSNSATKIFDWNGAHWQLQSSLTGVNNAVTAPCNDLNADGNFIAIGEPWSNFGNGITRVFQWDGLQWMLINDSIQGNGPTSSINAFGTSVSLSASGSIVAVGAPTQDNNGLNDAGKVYIFENSNLVNDNQLAQIDFYYFPNPTINNLYLKSSVKIEGVLVYDILGQELISKSEHSNEIILDMSYLNAGNYFVQMQTLYGSKTINIIKN